MTADDKFVPRRPTMTLRDLFAVGPWKVVLLCWLSAFVAVTIWVGRPSFRIAAVVSPVLCATLFAAIGGMAVAIAVAPFVHRPGAGSLLIVSTMLLCAIAGVAAANTIFRPQLLRGCPCAPLFPTGESALGHLASYVIPLVAALIWCRWLFAGFAGVGKLYDAARIIDFSKRLLIALPFRILASVVVLVGSVLFIHFRVSLPDDLSAVEIVNKLTSSDAAASLAAASPNQLEKIEMLRKSRAAEGEARLASLDFDGAWRPVHDAACNLVLPGTKREEIIVAADDAFERLDSEIRNGFATWRPSAVSGRAVLALLPISREGDVPRLPFLWPSNRRNELSSAISTSGGVAGVFRGVRIVEASLFTVRGAAGDVTTAVAMKILGTSSVDAQLPEALSRKLGRQPDGGVMSIGAGALCAVWGFGDVQVRLGPAVTAGDPQPTPGSPLWLTYYDTSVVERARRIGPLPPTLAESYGCGGATQSHSH